MVTHSTRLQSLRRGHTVRTSGRKVVTSSCTGQALIRLEIELGVFFAQHLN